MPSVKATVRIAWSFSADHDFHTLLEKEKKAFMKFVLGEIAARVPRKVLLDWAKLKIVVDKDGHKTEADVQRELRKRLLKDLPGKGFSLGPAGGHDYNKVDDKACTKKKYALFDGDTRWVIASGGLQAEMSLLLEWDTPVPAGSTVVPVPPRLPGGVLVPEAPAVKPSTRLRRTRRSTVKPRNR